MSDERFYLGNNGTTICDRNQGGSDGFNMLTKFEVVDLLNEQQATINKLKSDIEETEISIKLFEDDVNRLSKENEQLRQQHQRVYKFW